MSEWEIEERMPRFDDMREFNVWLVDGSVRTVRRIGNRSHFLTPGSLAFTDCTHPMQNVLCDESNVVGWRYAGTMAKELPRLSMPSFGMHMLTARL